MIRLFNPKPKPAPAPLTLDIEARGLPDAPPAGYRWKTRLLIARRPGENGATDILWSLTDVFDVDLDPSGQWVRYALPGPQGSRETSGWRRIPEDANIVEFQRHYSLEPTPEKPTSSTTSRMGKPKPITGDTDA
jgi:hypothetical protein